MLSNFTFSHENMKLIFIISYKSNDHISIKQQNSSSCLVNNLSLLIHCNPQQNISSLFLFLSLPPSFHLFPPAFSRSISLSPSLPLSISLSLPSSFYLSLPPPSLFLSLSPSLLLFPFFFFWVVPGFENRPCSLNGRGML